MQYARYLRENMEGHEFESIQVASRISALERDEARFAEVLEAVGRADAVLWAFPLYVFTVCSQYKRFIELVRERRAEGAFAGKYAASLSTSIHFFDHAAHDFIRGTAEDLGMRFVSSFSPRMDDLAKAEGRRQLLDFGRELAEAVEAGLPLPRRSARLPSASAPRATEPPAGLEASLGEGPQAATAAPPKRVLVLVDYPELAVGAMARRFAAAARKGGQEVRLLGLEEMGIKGGCMGCLKCGQANRCAWEGKDGFIESFRTEVLAADLLVYAGTIKGRSFSARWQAFLDRGFFNTHQRVLKGKQFLFLASGPLSALESFRQTLQAYVEWQGGNLVDIVSDEAESAAQLDGLIDGAAARALSALAAGSMKPATFLGVGGMKIFRDDIFGELKIVFKADHRSYRREGLYDFPQRNPLRRLAVWLGYWITSIPAVYKAMIKDFPAFMIMQFKPIFASRRRG
jgi:multimeric flavodoxin WrbA